MTGPGRGHATSHARMRHVGIIGGGLAGLTAAFRCVERGLRVTVLEAGPQLGGQISTELVDGFVVEHGAEGFVFRSEAVPKLATDLSLADELIEQLSLRSFGYRAGELSSLAPGEAASLLGFQVSKEDLGKGIKSLRRGMGSLIWALEGNLRGRAELRTSSPVQLVSRSASTVSLDLDGDALAVDSLVVATGARAAASLLQGVAGEAASALASARVMSSVTVSLAYAEHAIAHPVDGSGLVVSAEDQTHGFRACSFVSSKFANRAPLATKFLRVFFRPAGQDLVELDDQAWTTRAREAVEQTLGENQAPTHAWVSRWPDALPVFDDAHRQRVAALEDALGELPISLAGSAFHGAGIDAAVRSAEAAAEAVG